MKRFISLAIALFMVLGMACATGAQSAFETDVLVIGGGGAGISAAIAAAQQGAQVLLIEKVGYLGGATIMSGGKIPAANTKLQQEAGIEDSVAALARDILRPSNYSARQELVYTVAENAKGVSEWMEEMGVEWR